MLLVRTAAFVPPLRFLLAPAVGAAGRAAPDSSAPGSHPPWPATPPDDEDDDESVSLTSGSSYVVPVSVVAVSAVAPLGGLTHPYIVLWNVTRAAKAAPTLDTMETSKREEEPVLRSEQESGVRSWFSLTAFMHSHQFSCLRLSDGNPD